MKPRASLGSLVELVEADLRHAVLVMGPRQVGKTVLMQHLVQHLLNRGTPPTAIVSLSLDRPHYATHFLEDLYVLAREAGGPSASPRIFFLVDEIQYLEDWPRHLKVFVDDHLDVKCVVSGSASVALGRASRESGAGRFLDFPLPALTFFEYLHLRNISAGSADEHGNPVWSESDVAELNDHFRRYIRVGGYPAGASNGHEDAERLVRQTLIERTVTSDLPGLYGITDVEELRALFLRLAWNTGGEVSLDGISKLSGVSKPTLRRYLTFLEAAFLVRRVRRIDDNARRYQRDNRFKVHLMNPSHHFALFGALDDEEPGGSLVETAVLAQMFHHRNDIHYARWRHGEVDLVVLDAVGRPDWCVEIKWSDRDVNLSGSGRAMLEFVKKNPSVKHHAFTTQTRFGSRRVGDRTMWFLPASVFAYWVGSRVAPDPNRWPGPR